MIEIDFTESDGETTVNFTHRDLWDEEAAREPRGRLVRRSSRTSGGSWQS